MCIYTVNVILRPFIKYKESKIDLRTNRAGCLFCLFISAGHCEKLVYLKTGLFSCNKCRKEDQNIRE